MADYHMRSRQVGRRIAAARQTAGLSAADLAERLRWPRDTLVNYETVRRRLTVESLTEIAQALDMPAAVLLLDDPALARLITRLTREPEAIEDVGFFLDTRGDELPDMLRMPPTIACRNSSHHNPNAEALNWTR